jgi:hypothetical protein
VGSAAGRNRSDKSKAVLIVTHRSAQGRRPEGAQIPEYYHGFEKARLSGSIRSNDRIRGFTEGKNLAG